MYELFMTAFLNDVDLDAARSILSGYSWDEPHRRLYRVLHFVGANSNQPKALTKRNNIHGLPPEPDPFSYGLPSTEPTLNPSARYFDSAWNELSDIVKR